jgi:glutamine synthetase adenylyltransferase
MMDEHETWEMHGFNAIEHANNTSSTWNEFLAAIKILNVENHKDFTQHLMYLQEEPDQNFVFTLLQVYQDNQPLLRILHDLWNPQTDPLESYAQCHFSFKGTKETFKSLETDHKKAYQKHLENKLREQLSKL